MILFLAYRSLTLGSTWWRFLKSPEMDQKSSRASAASGNESRKCSGSGDPSDSQWKSWWFSPRIEWSRTKVDVLSTWSPPKRFYCSICDGEYEHFTTIRHFRLFRVESFSMGFWCVHLFQLLKVHNRYVSFPDSSRVQYITEEYSKEYLLTKLMDSSLVFCGYRMIFNNQWTNLNDRSFKMVLQIAFRTVFSHQTCDLACFVDSSSTPWNPPTNFHLDLLAKIQQMSLLQFCVLLSQQSHSFLNSEGRRTVFPREIFTSFAKFQGIVSINAFWFPSWLQEL